MNRFPVRQCDNPQDSLITQLLRLNPPPKANPPVILNLGL